MLGIFNKPLKLKKKMAEREGFEPPLPFRVNLISSQAPSTGLGHLSAGLRSHFGGFVIAVKQISTFPRVI